MIHYYLEKGKLKMTILDRAAELEKEWREEYDLLKDKKNLSKEEEIQLDRLKIKLGFKSSSSEIECFGCGS